MANRILPVKAMSVSRSLREIFWPTTSDLAVQPAGAKGRGLPSRWFSPRCGRRITFFTRYDKLSPASLLRPPNLAAMLATRSRLSRAVLRVEQSHRPALLRAPAHGAEKRRIRKFRACPSGKVVIKSSQWSSFGLGGQRLPNKWEKSALQASFLLRVHASSL